MDKLIRSDLANALYTQLRKNSEDSDSKDINNQLRLLSTQDISIIIKLLTQQISDALIAGNTVELREFGVFELRARKAKKNARNPKTGEHVEIPEHKVVLFRAGKHLRESVWKHVT